MLRVVGGGVPCLGAALDYSERTGQDAEVDEGRDHAHGEDERARQAGQIRRLRHSEVHI